MVQFEPRNRTQICRVCAFANRIRHVQFQKPCNYPARDGYALVTGLRDRRRHGRTSRRLTCRARCDTSNQKPIFFFCALRFA